jgi:hypothetical protein
MNQYCRMLKFGVQIPYKLAYKPPLCGPCETNDLSLGGAYSKGIYYGRWSVRHTNFAAILRQEGAYSKGGAYMLVYTVGFIQIIIAEIPSGTYSFEACAKQHSVSGAEYAGPWRDVTNPKPCTCMYSVFRAAGSAVGPEAEGCMASCGIGRRTRGAWRPGPITHSCSA